MLGPVVPFYRELHNTPHASTELWLRGDSICADEPYVGDDDLYVQTYWTRAEAEEAAARILAWLPTAGVGDKLDVRYDKFLEVRC